MSAIALFPLLLIVLLVFGSLAAVVFLVVRAIANKRTGSFASPAGLVLATAVVCLIVAAAWSNVSPPRFSPARFEHQIGQAGFLQESDDWNLSRGTIVLIAVAIAVVSLLAFGRRGEQCNGRRHSGWIIAGLLLLAFFVVVPTVSYQSQRASVTHHQGSDQLRIAQDVHRRIAVDPSAQQVAEEIAQQHGGLNQRSMQEIWEHLHEPRISLEAVVQGGNVEANVAETSSAALASAIGEESVDENDENNDNNSLTDRAERIARLARLLAVVADQVSDVASAVGRGFVASDSPKTPEMIEPHEAVDEVALAEHVEPAETAPATPRPAWIDDPPKRFGNNWREVVVVGDYATTEECYREADRQLMRATYEHLQTLTGSSNDRDQIRYFDNAEYGPMQSEIDEFPERLRSIGVGIDYVRRDIVRNEYVETVQRSVGEMQRLYTQVEFTPSVKRDLRTRWDAFQRKERFAVVGVGAGSVLGLVGLMFGLLRVDTWTKGYYTKRLFLGVPTAIIGLIALLVALS
jgi:hypothetical protein